MNWVQKLCLEIEKDSLGGPFLFGGVMADRQEIAELRVVVTLPFFVPKGWGILRFPMTADGAWREKEAIDEVLRLARKTHLREWASRVRCEVRL